MDKINTIKQSNTIHYSIIWYKQFNKIKKSKIWYVETVQNHTVNLEKNSITHDWIKQCRQNVMKNSRIQNRKKQYIGIV